MSKVVIANSTCLIGLGKIGRLDILRQLFGHIIVPSAVYHEVVIRGMGRIGAKEVEEAAWIETHEVKNTLAVNTLKLLMIGTGEAEAIALAVEANADFIILDDWKARQIALGMSLPVIGTVAVLTRAVEKGFIEDLTSVLQDLRKAGFRFPLF